MDLIALLNQAADVAAGLDTATLSDEVLSDTLVEWHRAKARLAAGEAKLTRVFDVRNAYRADGSKSPAAWLERHCNASKSVMQRQVRFAKRLPLMPLVAEALAAGLISERHAEILGTLAAHKRPAIAVAFPQAEKLLLGYALDLPFDQFEIAVRYWESVVDEDGVEEQAQDDHAARNMHMSQTLDDNWVLHGEFDPLQGAIINNEIRRIEEELFKQDWAAAKAIHGDDTNIEHLERTAAQRRADATEEMARRSAAMPADAQPARPLFVVHVGDESLRRLCELSIGLVVTPGQLVPHVTDAELQRIVYEGRSRRITDLGERSRLFTGPLRDAILWRDRHCQHPGCRVPAEHCQVDHDIPSSKGGLTNQDNGKAECGSHNRHKADTLPEDYPGYHNQRPLYFDPRDNDDDGDDTEEQPRPRQHESDDADDWCQDPAHPATQDTDNEPDESESNPPQPEPGDHSADNEPTPCFGASASDKADYEPAPLLDTCGDDTDDWRQDPAHPATQDTNKEPNEPESSPPQPERTDNESTLRFDTSASDKADYEPAPLLATRGDDTDDAADQAPPSADKPDHNPPQPEPERDTADNAATLRFDTSDNDESDGRPADTHPRPPLRDIRNGGNDVGRRPPPRPDDINHQDHTSENRDEPPLLFNLRYGRDDTGERPSGGSDGGVEDSYAWLFDIRNGVPDRLGDTDSRALLIDIRNGAKRSHPHHGDGDQTGDDRTSGVDDPPPPPLVDTG